MIANDKWSFPLIIAHSCCLITTVRVTKHKGGMAVHETHKENASTFTVSHFQYSETENFELTTNKSFVVLSEEEYLVSAIKNNFASNVIKILSIIAVLLNICFRIYL